MEERKKYSGDNYKMGVSDAIEMVLSDERVFLKELLVEYVTITMSSGATPTVNAILGTDILEKVDEIFKLGENDV